MKRLTILLFGVFLLLNSCKKENRSDSQKFCWYVLDPVGQQLDTFCDKTEAEFLDINVNNVNGRSGRLGDILTPCQYYHFIQGEAEFCWEINGRYMKNLKQSDLDFMQRCNNITSFRKIDCNTYCQNWKTQIRSEKKSDHTFSLSPIIIQQYCGDTLSRIFENSLKTIRETPDSIFYRQFLERQ